MPTRVLVRAALGFLVVLSVVGCVGCGSADAPDDGEELATSDLEELSGSPDALDIGMNGGPDQFTYFDRFVGASSGKGKGPRICHTYPAWDVALQPPGQGDPTKPGSRAWLENWLRHAEGHCDEALMSFKSHPKSDGSSGNELGHVTKPPSVYEYAKAFAAFRATTWPGWTGKFSFTPWNEPNNGAGSGTGLGEPLSPERAAEYYLTIRHDCHGADCKVAAGDMASNGNMVDDYESRCSDDNVVPADLCKRASWLDRYKNAIANHADDRAYRLGKGFRPEYFAFHPWFEMNGYLVSHVHCGIHDRCTTRYLLKNLRGSWGSVELWDTEVGVAQDGLDDFNERERACGAAFLVRLSSKLSRRITRVYYTRMSGGNPDLFKNGQPRDAFEVLARRDTTSRFGRCD